MLSRINTLLPGNIVSVKQPASQQQLGSSTQLNLTLNTPGHSPGDSFAPSQPKATGSPRFAGGWMQGLSLLGGVLAIGRNSLDRSMKRDEYERNKRRIYFKKRSYTEDVGHKYRTVTVMKGYDYNDKRRADKDTESVGPWHYRRRRGYR